MKNILGNINLNDYDIVKKRPRLVIMFDLDDTLNNFLEVLIKEWNKRTGSNKTIDDCSHWDLGIDFDKSIFDIFREKSFFYNLEPVKHAVETINKLISNVNYEVYIVSSCGTVDEIADKYRWIEKWFPEFKMSKFISCSEKHIINADIIFDDNAETLMRCSEYMEIVAPRKRHNEYLDCVHIDDISEAIPIIEKLYIEKYKKS